MVRGGAEAEARALLPLVATRTTFHRAPVNMLTWASALVACPDHLDVVADPDAPLEALLPALESMPWDIILFRDVAEHAPGVERLTAALRRNGHHVTREALHVCPFLLLPDTWDDYLATLSPSRRQQIRRKERKLVRERAASFTDYPPADVDEGWRRLVALHAQRWKGPGAFTDPRVLPMLQAFRDELSDTDDFWLSTLDLDSTPTAAWCGFAWGDTVYFYQGGRDPRWDTESVGLVLMARMIRRAIERGYRRFDFMRGDEGYKRIWTSTARSTYQFVIFRKGWRGAGLRAMDWARRARLRLRARHAVTTTAAPDAAGAGTARSSA